MTTTLALTITLADEDWAVLDTAATDQGATLAEVVAGLLAAAVRATA